MEIEITHDPGRSTARRTPGTDGVTERAAFLGPPDDRIFTVQHLPRAPRGAVLVCSSVKIEFHANYNREVELARKLAEAGFAVGRFHYRGAGNSDGEEITFASMLEDAETAATDLVRASGASLRAITGTRFGATAAMVLATRKGGLPLALWQPTLDPLGYMDDILKKGRLATMGKEPSGSIPNAEGLEVLGYIYRPQLFEDAAAVLDGSPLAGIPSCLFLEMTSRGFPSGRYSAAAEAMQSRGARSSVVAVKGFPQLWFLGPRRQHPDPDLVSDMVRWLDHEIQGAEVG